MTEQDKVDYITMLLHGVCLAYKIDELESRGLVTQEVKQAARNFERIFNRKHSRELTALFNVTSEESESGDAFLEAQTAVELLGKSIGSLKYPVYPDLISIVEAYKKGDVIDENEYVKIKK